MPNSLKFQFMGNYKLYGLALGNMFPFPLKGEHKEGENSGSERQTETG